MPTKKVAEKQKYKVTSRLLHGFKEGALVTEEELPYNCASVEILVKSGILKPMSNVSKQPTPKEG